MLPSRVVELYYYLPLAIQAEVEVVKMGPDERGALEQLAHATVMLYSHSIVTPQYRAVSNIRASEFCVNHDLFTRHNCVWIYTRRAHNACE